MKKLLIALIATMSFGAVAQTVNTATGPNNVYIQQVGSSNTITIEQVGGTNQVGGITNTSATAVDGTGVTTLTPAMPSATNYGTITGSTNVLGITQHGNDNSTQYNIQGGNNAYTSVVTGNNNQTTLTVGDQNHASNNHNTIGETVTGNSNLIITDIVGSNNSLTTGITGSNNQVTQTVTTSNASINDTINGSYNVMNFQQTDAAGMNGHVLVAATQGDYNSITTQQQGTNDTTLNINTVGSHNTITIRSSSATIVNPVTAIAR
jgi:hypothetical protein